MKAAVLKSAERDSMCIRDGITSKEIERIKASIRIGTQIKWHVLMGEAESSNHYPTSEKVLTVTRKSKYLFEAIDSAGLTHSIRYAELAAARRAGQ